MRGGAAETKAQLEKAKAVGNPEIRKALMHTECDVRIKKANKRRAEAEARMKAAQGK